MIANKIEYGKCIKLANKAADAYYNSGTPIMSDENYDLLMESIQEFEENTGIVFASSPTQKVGAPVLSALTKVSITPKPMLSLEKCHSDEEVAAFAGKQEMIAMLKLDGLSVRVKYNNGKLMSANTRGNGVEGTDITEHIKQFQNVPLKISYQDELILDGEAIIKIPDFEKINQNNEFKNPRNAASGALNVLDTKLVKDRKLSFVVWDVISDLFPSSEEDEFRFLTDKFREIECYGFEIVPYYWLAGVDKNLIQIATNELMKKAEHNYPCDGIVWKFDNIEYGNSLGQTSHHFKNGIAWKPEVELVESTLKSIDWTMGRTGILTPVAVFDPIELDGSVVERASLHNISVMNDTLNGRGWIGQKLKIYKANMIIPQIFSAEEDDNESEKTYIQQPWLCPICGEPLCEQGTDSIFLVCENSSCDGKMVNQLDHFCGKKGLDIKGLSKATLEKLIDWGWIGNFVDLYNLKDHRTEWVKKDGFGERSVDNILAAIEESKECNLENFISAIGIPLIGLNVAKEICKHVNSYSDFRDLINSKFNFSEWDGFGPEKTSELLNYNYEIADNLATFITFTEKEDNNSNTLDNLIICITGSLNQFKNRNDLKAQIEMRGGRVTGSVSGKTSILINNDATSTSAKNTSAKRLGIPILTEKEFIEKYLQ